MDDIKRYWVPRDSFRNHREGYRDDDVVVQVVLAADVEAVLAEQQEEIGRLRKELADVNAFLPLLAGDSYPKETALLEMREANQALQREVASYQEAQHPAICHVQPTPPPREQGDEHE